MPVHWFLREPAPSDHSWLRRSGAGMHLGRLAAPHGNNSAGLAVEAALPGQQAADQVPRLEPSAPQPVPRCAAAATGR